MARDRLKFVVNPNYLQSRVQILLQEEDANIDPIVIPTSSSFHLGYKFRQIVETKNFQRLRGIKQLSFCDWVYPAAVHNRFEHSLGVFQIATESVEYLSMQNSFRKYFGEGHVSSLLTAALLHDVGHYPFAHVIEHYCASRFSEDKELRSTAHHAFNSQHIMENDPMISKIIATEMAGETVSECKNILSGKRDFLSSLLDSSIDVDKIDYLKRDSYHCGINFGRGYNATDLMKGIEYRPQEDSVVFSTERVNQVSGFLVLQAQMLSEVYWNANIRVLFAMFHRFIDVCVMSDRQNARKNFVEFVQKLRFAASDAEAFEKAFIFAYERFLKAQSLSPSSKSWMEKPYDGPVWSLISLFGSPDPALLYKCANVFTINEKRPRHVGVHSNIFNSIIKTDVGSTISGGSIDWDTVKRLRQCYISSFEEKRIPATALDVLIDIPWGKNQNPKIKIIEKNGSEVPISSVTHLSSTIFSDLTIHAAPIRVFVSPRIHLMGQHELLSINHAALDKFYDPRRQIDTEAEDYRV